MTNKTKQNRFKPVVTRIKLNPEQAVLLCSCSSGTVYYESTLQVWHGREQMACDWNVGGTKPSSRSYCGGDQPIPGFGGNVGKIGSNSISSS